MLMLEYKHSRAVSGASPQSYALMSLGKGQAENAITYHQVLEPSCIWQGSLGCLCYGLFSFYFIW